MPNFVRPPAQQQRVARIASSVDTSAVSRILEGFANAGDRLNEQIVRRIGDERVQRATLAGNVDGAKPGPQLRRDASAAGQAYDRAVLETVAGDTEIQISADLEKARQESAQDLDGYLKKVETLTQAYSANLQSIDPALARRAVGQIQRQARPVIAKLYQDRLDRLTAQAEATVEQRARIVRSDALMRFAASGVNPESMTDYLHSAGELLELMSAHGPRDGFDLVFRDGTKVTLPADPARQAVFSPAEIATQYAEFLDEGLEQLVLGEVDNRIDDEGFTAARRWLLRINSNLLAFLPGDLPRPDQDRVDAMVGRGLTAISRREALLDAEAKIAKEQGDAVATVEDARLTALLLDNRLTTDALHEGLRNGASPGTVRALRDHISGGIARAAVSDPGARMQVLLDPLQFTASQVALDARLSDGDARELMKYVTDARQEAARWRSNPEVEEGARRVAAAFGYVRDGFMSRFATPEQIKRGEFALTEFYERLEQLPVGSRPAIAVDLSDLMTAEEQSRTVLGRIDEAEATIAQQLPTLGVSTVEQALALDSRELTRPQQNALLLIKGEHGGLIGDRQRLDKLQRELPLLQERINRAFDQRTQ